MYSFFAKDIEFSLNDLKNQITSLKLKGKEATVSACPIFVARFRNLAGDTFYLSSTDAKNVSLENNTLIFTGFSSDLSTVIITVKIDTGNSISWYIEVTGIPNAYALEWVQFPKACLPKLINNNKQGGKILFPYNEGMLVSDEALLPRYEPEFPSSGAYFTFPNMVCSQFLAYLFDDVGLYIGAHDCERGLKGIDFYPYNDGIVLEIRLYSGCDFGMDYKPLFPVVWQACDGNWKDAAQIYRSWLENNLPKNVVPTKANKSLPAWYENSPLIVTYPVRGTHDMGDMSPNCFFPFVNALPILDKIKQDTGCQIMSLLMHWEGTAPWAPPYVWPPFGGLDIFNEFRDKLHKNGDLLGVYCSGFGYTKQSTLIEEYNCEERIEKEDVLKGVCHSPKNKPELGITCCPYQRYGYDICPASDKGQEILDSAYSPLFESGVDYAQILDQNHGGGQYLCYAREHNHPPMPGKWMTDNMVKLLTQWNKKSNNMVFGCESAAAEPFIANLLMSDNRYELNYPFGDVVPVFAYLYHQYLRNFMGNQCGCPFEPTVDTLRYRLAYSFSVGDLMTLVLSPKGGLMSHWGTHDFSIPPDWEKTMRFIKNMNEFYKNGAKEYLYAGKMANAPDILCKEISIPLFRGKKEAILPSLLSSVWEKENGKAAYIVINPQDCDIPFTINDKEYICPALNGVIVTE